MNFETKQMEIGSLVIGKNVRVRNDVDLTTLIDSITSNGLETPITVVARPSNGKFEVLRGHRRLTAIQEIRRIAPNTFKNLFPNNKIACTIVKGVSYEEAQKLKIDSGTTVELKNKYEALLCASIMFNDSKTENDVANELHAILCRTSRGSGLTSEKQKTLAKHQSEILIARDAKKWDIVDSHHKAIRKLLLEFHRGHVQQLKAVWQCPYFVMACKEYEYTGVVPEGYTEKEVLRLTYSEVKRLLKAFELDLEDLDDNEIPKYSKVKPGKNFESKLQQIRDEKKGNKKKTGTQTVTDTRLSMVDLEKEHKASVYQSYGFRLLLRHCMGKKVKGLKEADEMCAMIECINEHDTKLMAQIKVAYTKVLKDANKKK